MQRWQNNAVYSNSYLSEKALYEFVVACGTMEALQGRAEEFKALTVKNAIALVKDQEALREKAYKYCKETIREKGPANILAQADTVQTDMDLVSMVNKAMQQNSIEITVDELLAMFYSDFVIMENIEVYQQAEIPGEWKEKVKGYAQDIFDSCKKLWQQEQLPAARQWQPAWILDYNLLHEERHRRLIPVNDTELDKKIALHKLLKPV
jgi:hypothetical protein